MSSSRFRFHLGINHILVLFFILILFQLMLSYVHQISKQNILNQTLEIIKMESAERIAHQSSIALELILENTLDNPAEYHRENIRAIDVTLNQILLERNTFAAGLLVQRDERMYLLRSGESILHYIMNGRISETALQPSSSIYKNARQENLATLSEGRIHSAIENAEIFHVYVPFLIKGEYRGAYYLEMKPDISSIASEIKNTYGDTGAIFSALILFGLLAMYYLSIYILRERNNALEILYSEREKQLTERIEREKEHIFTRRIYHAHHKAEKIMGFIKSDLRAMTRENMDVMKSVIIRYGNFISRIIYDMKSYDPPIHTIRNPIW